MQPEAGAWQGRAEGPVTPSGNAYRMCIIIDITYTQAGAGGGKYRLMCREREARPVLASMLFVYFAFLSLLLSSSSLSLSVNLFNLKDSLCCVVFLV